MALFQFPDGAAMFDSTPIENMFLLEYMPYAPDGFVRAYLYARMLALHPEIGEGIAEIARNLRMDEDAVDNAFLYWEGQGLMQKMSSNPPTYRILPLRSADLRDTKDNDYFYRYRDYISALQAIFGEGSIMHDPDYRMAYEWVEVRKMEQDAVLYLVEEERAHSKAKLVSTIFSHVNKKILDYADRDIRTLEAVKLDMMHFDESVRELTKTVADRLALYRPPTRDELTLAQKWVEEWHLTLQDVSDACEQTVHSRQPNFAYLDSILANRQKERGGAFAAMKAALKELGAPSVPTPEQMKHYEKWHEMGFEDGTILLAAKELNRHKKTTFDDLVWGLEKWAELRLFSQSAAEAYVHKDEEMRQMTRQCLERAGSDKKPSKGEISTVEQWRVKYSDELILYAADCALGMDKPLLYMQKVLNEWEKAGIQTVEAAQIQHREFRSAAAKNPVKQTRTDAPAKNPALNYEQRTYTADDFGDDFFFNPETQSYGGNKT